MDFRVQYLFIFHLLSLNRKLDDIPNILCLNLIKVVEQNLVIVWYGEQAAVILREVDDF